ncbi:MAG: apolipoprotein N-acyltransferase [Bacteroidales bacterium]|nr:apolipoprotein N-acyltransferase [Bacteroidales bacterium]
MKRYQKLLLSILSGVLLALGWPEHGFPLLLFVGFIPLLVIENQHLENKSENGAFGIYGYGFIAFAIFNILTTYWIYNSAFVGIVAAVLLNSFLMTGAYQLFHITHRKMLNEGAGYFALIGYWLSIEYLHLRWDLNWPWLNLGNGFAAFPKWIQWYEYTGIFGGSLWILIVNILLFRFIHIRFIQKICSRKVAFLMISTLVVLIGPILFSYYTYYQYKEVPSPIDVVVVQPNLDPYTEQYELAPEIVTSRMLELVGSRADSMTDFIVFPESAIQEYAWEDQLDSIGSLRTIRLFQSTYPKMKAIVGISTRSIFLDGQELTVTARKKRDADYYYDSYNTALYIPRNGNYQLYHKSKLTPGVEKMPYPRIFKFLEKYALDLGGTIGSLGTDAEQIPFKVNDSLKIASVICYESAYGEFVNRFIQQGANVIFVITNDGWWGNTPGHRQHLLFSVLRAIETRRSVARSANTGISCFINQRGDISERSKYWVPDVKKATINTNSGLTFYVRYGDYIGRIFLLVAALMLLLTVSLSLRKGTLR